MFRANRILDNLFKMSILKQKFNFVEILKAYIVKNTKEAREYKQSQYLIIQVLGLNEFYYMAPENLTGLFFQALYLLTHSPFV